MANDESKLVVRIVAHSGLMSRRHAAEAIRAGRVTVAGAVIDDPMARAGEAEEVLMDGNPLPRRAALFYWLLNKPRGFICSNRDRYSERLAIRLLPEMPGVRLFSAGRLDAASEGMILFTNDGALVRRLEAPESRICKYYDVETAHALSPAALELLRGGICDGGGRLQPVAVESQGGCCCRFVLDNGKRHEIRRMVQACGTTVRRLIRVRIGDLAMGGLAPGEYRALAPEELTRLTQTSL